MQTAIQQTLAIPPSVPRGWGYEVFTDSLGHQFPRAIDPDGFRWYWEGEWVLNVPYFRTGVRGEAQDSIAVCDHVSGHKECHITPKGTICLSPVRFVGQKHWNH